MTLSYSSIARLLLTSWDMFHDASKMEDVHYLKGTELLARAESEDRGRGLREFCRGANAPIES